jgi:hypothetical protein
MSSEIITQALSELKQYGEEGTLDGLDSDTLIARVMAGGLPQELTDDKQNIIDAKSLKSLGKEGNDSVDIRMILRDATLPQKIKLALFGNSACRNILILDSNKLIQLCVLKNSKLVEQEVVEYSRNTNVSQVVLRAISDKREWMKSYDVKYNIVTNPKTPSDIALKWLRYLQFNDIKEVSRSRNVPQVVASSAKKKVVEAEEQKRKGRG